MVTFNTFVKRFDNLQAFIEKKSKEIIVKHGKQMAEMIIEQQLEGKGGDGKRMQSGYSSGYAKKRKKKGLQTRYVDLHFTGNMHKGMKPLVVPGGVDIRSEEPYEYYVRANFPEGFKLTKENANNISEMVAKALAPEMKKYLVK